MINGPSTTNVHPPLCDRSESFMCCELTLLESRMKIRLHWQRAMRGQSKFARTYTPETTSSSHREAGVKAPNASSESPQTNSPTAHGERGISESCNLLCKLRHFRRRAHSRAKLFSRLIIAAIIIRVNRANVFPNCVVYRGDWRALNRPSITGIYSALYPRMAPHDIKSRETDRAPSALIS